MHSEGKWIPLRLVECTFLFFRNLVNSKMDVLKEVDERVYFRNCFLLYYFMLKTHSTFSRTYLKNLIYQVFEQKKITSLCIWMFY